MTEAKTSSLVLPTSGYELDCEEMCYLEGGGTIRVSIGVQFTIGGFLSSTMISTLCAMVTGYAVTKVAGVGAMIGGIIGAAVGAIVGIILGSALANAINNHISSMGLIAGTSVAWLPSLSVWIPFVKSSSKSFVLDIGKFIGGAIGGGIGGPAGATAGAGSWSHAYA